MDVSGDASKGLNEADIEKNSSSKIDIIHSRLFAKPSNKMSKAVYNWNAPTAIHIPLSPLRTEVLVSEFYIHWESSKLGVKLVRLYHLVACLVAALPISRNAGYQI
jgi:hypothetical protein